MTRPVRQATRTGSRPDAIDRRVQRTQRALVQALVELVREKSYDVITVQDLLDRANVGRSTFYAHYRSKDDLLLRSFEAMLDMLDCGMPTQAGTTTRLAPVRELFHHVGRARTFHRALARAGMLDRLYQVGTEQLSRTITNRLASSGRYPGRDVPAAVAARAMAGAVFGLLRWWIDVETPYDPDDMDRMYHAIVAGPQ